MVTRLFSPMMIGDDAIAIRLRSAPAIILGLKQAWRSHSLIWAPPAITRMADTAASVLRSTAPKMPIQVASATGWLAMAEFSQALKVPEVCSFQCRGVSPRSDAARFRIARGAAFLLDRNSLMAASL